MKNRFSDPAMRVSVVSIIVNVILSAFKLAAGVVANSGAMVSDAVHSASDIFSTIIVIIGIRFAGKKPDKEHPYGHERMECVAAIILATVLFATGIGLGGKAFLSIIFINHNNLAVPGGLALLAAIVSIAVKEWMYWYTRSAAKKTNSPALMADAWHHRSDAFSSVGALVGIGGAMLGVAVMDQIAQFVISLFIIKAAYDVFKDAVDRMIDKACDEQLEEELAVCVKSHDGVLGINMLHTRVFGNKIYVDLEISVCRDLPLFRAHELAEKVHNSIEEQFQQVKHIMIHIEPNERVS